MPELIPLTDSFTCGALRSMVMNKAEEINEWIELQLQLKPAPFYSSVDVRCNLHKVAPVDMNLFPAGFNNFSPESKLYSSQFIPFEGKKVLIITENFERNDNYYENVVQLSEILKIRNNDVELGNYEINQAIKIKNLKNLDYTLKPISITDGMLHSEDGSYPELIILNNDLMNGLPAILTRAQQPILPSPQYGWYQRSKYSHQVEYQKVVDEFCAHFDFDPWLISTEFDICEGIDFREQVNIDYLANKAEKLISKIKDQYHNYGIRHTPHLFIKSDHGTYGMGIIIAYSGEDIIKANRKSRKKMHTTKGKRSIKTTYIQEGVPSQNSYNGNIAEPIVYNLEKHPVCIISRYNPTKDSYENLNSTGAKFQDITKSCTKLDTQVIKLISKLSVISAARELENGIYKNPK